MKKSNSNPFNDPSIAAGYETWYDTVGQRADRLEKALLKELLEKYPQAETILEVGCGTGHFTRWSQTQGFRAIGLDLSYAMLIEARQFKPHIYILGNTYHLPFPKGAFDVVMLITALEFLQEPLFALREAQRVARQGVILGVINRIGWVGRQYRRQGGVPWDSAQFFTPGELTKMVEQACDEGCVTFWKTTLWRHLPCALPLPWGGFIGMGVKKG